MTSVVSSVAFRVEVADIDAALPTYQQLAGVRTPGGSTSPEFSLAAVGPFLLLQAI